MTTKTVTEQEREDFEAACDLNNISFTRQPDGTYFPNPAQHRWEGWHMKAALQSQVSDTGWKEAAIAWEVCASLHRQYCKGKDPLFTTRQGDFVRHATESRERAFRAEALKSQDREVIIEALKCAQNNECGPRRPFGSSDSDSADYDCDAFMWDYYQRAIDHARRIEGGGE